MKSKSNLQSLISIVIPCRNEKSYIARTIEFIYKNDYPIDLIEVIIVDGMSDDGTRDLFAEIQNKYPGVFIVDNPCQKTPFAMNLGIKRATGDIVIICGARFMLSENYLQEIVKVLNSYKHIGCVGGKIINIYENNTSRAISKAMASKFGVGFKNFRTIDKDIYVDTVTPPAFRKSIFQELGYFDELLSRNQDDDFSFRIIKAGYKILLRSNISFKYYVRASFINLFTQYSQYGYWKVFVNKKHKTITTGRQLFPISFVLSSTFLFLLSFFNFYFTLLLCIELLLYFSLSLYFAIQIHRLRLDLVLLHVYTCLILHFSYGYGYLLGIIDFFILNKTPSAKSEVLSR